MFDGKAKARALKIETKRKKSAKKPKLMRKRKKVESESEGSNKPIEGRLTGCTATTKASARRQPVIGGWLRPTDLQERVRERQNREGDRDGRQTFTGDGVRG